MASAGRLALVLVISAIGTSRSQYYQQQTRSLSGTPATDGNNVTNAEIYRIITQQLLDGFAIWRVKMFNDRVFVEKTRRSYWLGDRYYRMDNDYYWKSRDTCAYRMNETERRNLVYEDGIPIYDIIYQFEWVELIHVDGAYPSSSLVAGANATLNTAVVWTAAEFTTWSIPRRLHLGEDLGGMKLLYIFQVPSHLC
ncbi:hypothetical protein Y032_0110g140 [Ancylostoma ceylanicum]|uniref:Uncharacterized protein n=2 Tax=Ancylostoma ceylanicum TaxID=53326 RepID=A0A016TEF6_9BILA|nr:hypothetical protein Y032_0110g140 [Ancylostoma ceylanicum]